MSVARAVSILCAIPLAGWASLTCETRILDKPYVRAEGLAELIGEVLIRCYGTPPVSPLQIQAVFSSNTTTKLVDRTISEGLLLVEKPGDPIDRTKIRLNETAFRAIQASSNSLRWVSIPTPLDENGAIDVQYRLTGIRVAVAGTSAIGGVMFGFFTIRSNDVEISRTTTPVAQVLQGLRVTSRRCDNSSAITIDLTRDAGQNADMLGLGRSSGKFQLSFRFSEPPELPDSFLPSEESKKRQPPPNPLISRADSGDQGTRLVAIFNNVPSGVRLFVTTQENPLSSSRTIKARLLRTSDFNGSGPFVPATPIGTASCGNLSLGVAELPVTEGRARGVWEVTASDPERQEDIGFGVAIAFEANKVGIGTATVNGTFGPVSSVNTASSQAPIPRFADTSTATRLFSINNPIQLLLFSGLSNQFGMDAGVLIRNTDQLPGACALHYSGTTTAGGPAPPPQVTPAIGPGGEIRFTLSAGGAGVVPVPGFRGCVLAVCLMSSAEGGSLAAPIGSISDRSASLVRVEGMADARKVEEGANSSGCTFSRALNLDIGTVRQPQKSR